MVQLAIVNDKGKRYVVLSAHFAIHDPSCEREVMQAVEEAYIFGVIQRRNQESYSDFVKATKSGIEAAQDFWRRSLDLVPKALFPNLDPRSSAGLLQIDGHSRYDFPVSSTSEHEVPTLATLQAAWILILSIFEDSSDVLSHMTFENSQKGDDHSRPHGPTLCIGPVRMAIEGESRIDHFLLAADHIFAQRATHARIGLEAISELVDDESASSVQSPHCLFVARSLDSREGDLLEQYGLQAVKTGLAPPWTFPITVECVLALENGQNTLGIEITFSTEAIRSDQVERLAFLLSHVVDQLLHLPRDTKISEIGVISHKDKEFLAKINSTISSV